MKNAYHESLGISGSMALLKLLLLVPFPHHPSRKACSPQEPPLPTMPMEPLGKLPSPDETMLLSLLVLKLFPLSQFSFSIGKKFLIDAHSWKRVLHTKQFHGALYLLPWVTHSFSLTSTYRFSPKLLSHLPNLPHLSPGKGEATQPWLEKHEYWRLGSGLCAGLSMSLN